MITGSFETAANQVANTAQNTGRRTVAGVKSETSVTGRANALLGKAAKTAEGWSPPRRDRGGTLSSEEARTAGTEQGAAFVAPDGYVRKSPVQELVISPHYKKRIIKRAIAWFVVVILVVLIAYALYRTGIIGF